MVHHHAHSAQPPYSGCFSDYCSSAIGFFVGRSCRGLLSYTVRCAVLLQDCNGLRNGEEAVRPFRHKVRPMRRTILLKGRDVEGRPGAGAEAGQGLLLSRSFAGDNH